MQALSSAAVADLDVPGAAWSLTPKALLAVGLLAEEAARLELAERFPPPPLPPAAPAQQQQQQAAASSPGRQPNSRSSGRHLSHR